MNPPEETSQQNPISCRLCRGVGARPGTRNCNRRAGCSFERFKQVRPSDHSQYGGKELDLAICKEIIDAHGGRIWMESKEGKGNTFKFLVPNSS
ncbi:MAG: hypothetical protein K2Z81_25210 [Cyanobacteria bacterium]|nr:hypothetical protein [Cyanobacteriota bacterium]